MTKKFLFSLLLSVAAGTASAAEPLPNGTMRFSIFAPMAKEVVLQGSGVLRKQKMIRQTDGSWTYVSAVLPPERYT